MAAGLSGSYGQALRDPVLRSDARKTGRRGHSAYRFFPVLAVEANELIVGANDSHLDFRIAVVHRQRRETPTNQKEVVLASVVRCHNRTGKLYITLIAPFHRLVVRAMLKRAAARGWR